MFMLIGIDASRAFVKDKTGTENYSIELIKAMLKLKASYKHDFRLYVKGGIEVDNFIQDKKNVEIVKINWPRLWTQGGLALECLRRTPQVLFVPAHTLPILRKKKMKTVVTIHGLEYEYLPQYYKFPQSLYLNKSTEYAVREANSLISVSKWTKGELVERLGALEDKIQVIYEGIGERFLKTKEYGVNKKVARQVKYKYQLPDKYILFVGTIQPRKNLVRLIEAFSKLDFKKDKFKDFKLVIAGKWGWMTEKIAKAPKKYGVESKVKFIGRVADSDLPAVYKSASLFCWPSLMEGFGLPVLEAMIMGVPVICSNKGALPEVVGKAGLQIDPEKVEEITKAIELVLGNKELKEGLVERGYRNIKRFSWEKAAKETLKMLTR